MEFTVLVKALQDFGTTAVLIAFVLYTGDRREKRFNDLVEKTLGSVRQSLDNLKEEAVKGNELTRLLLARLDGIKEITR